MAGGYSHSLFSKSDGTAWATGRNNFGQLGDGTTTDRSRPVQVPSLSDVRAVAAGYSFSLFSKSDGTVWAAGRNNYGQLGDGTFGSQSAPLQVASLDIFVEGWTDNLNLGWLYRFTPDWAYSPTMDFVYLSDCPWIFNPDFGYFYWSGDDIREGGWIFMYSDKKWAWLVSSNEGLIVYTDETYDDFMNPNP